MKPKKKSLKSYRRRAIMFTDAFMHPDFQIFVRHPEAGKEFRDWFLKFWEADFEGLGNGVVKGGEVIVEL